MCGAVAGVSKQQYVVAKGVYPKVAGASSCSPSCSGLDAKVWRNVLRMRWLSFSGAGLGSSLADTLVGLLLYAGNAAVKV